MAKALKNPACGPAEGSGTGSGVMCAGLCGCCVSMFEYNLQIGGFNPKSNHLDVKLPVCSKSYALLNPTGLTALAIIGRRAAPTSPASPPSRALVMMVPWTERLSTSPTCLFSAGAVAR